MSAIDIVQNKEFRCIKSIRSFSGGRKGYVVMSLLVKVME